MSNTRNTTAGIAAEIAKGWQPNNYLTNMSMAYFQKPEDYVAHSIFPVCPVQLSASYYYTFSKEDLARDNVQPKPAFGTKPLLVIWMWIIWSAAVALSMA